MFLLLEIYNITILFLQWHVCARVIAVICVCLTVLQLFQDQQ